ncbi:MAG: ferrous iron transporter B, partial [Thermoprotei archaeon]
MSKKYLIALAGNPNTGKSTVFNTLTGARQHIGNWPGKTIEKKEGICEYENIELKIVDLPGTYSLTAYSDEELIARDFIIKEKPTVVVNIVDASNLSRNLYLTLRLLELTDKVIIALNMMDIAEEKGMKIDVEKLSELLGVPIVPMVASEGIGIKKLLDTIVDLIKGKIRTRPLRLNFGQHIESQIKSVERELEDIDLKEYPKRWLAIKLLEGDTEVEEMIRKSSRGQ